MKKDRQILVNMIQTPDGTILVSNHRHDYRTHDDKNGLTYMVDGGDSYLRRNIHPEAPYKDLSIYSDDPYEEIRKYLCRGGRGINGDEPLKYVPLCEMNDNWVQAVIEYEEDYRPNNKYLKYFRLEQKYRSENNITITE